MSEPTKAVFLSCAREDTDAARRGASKANIEMSEPTHRAGRRPEPGHSPGKPACLQDRNGFLICK